MSNPTALLLFVLLLTACSPAQQPMDSGIEGTVTVGPMCPVVQENIPCPDDPFIGTFTILNMEGGRVAEFQTDEEGRFRIGLAAGDYVLHLDSPKPMRGVKDTRFTVGENKYTVLEIKLDSGIR